MRGQIWPANHIAQDRPELFLVTHNEDVAVTRSVQLARRQGWVARSRLAALPVALVKVPRRNIVQILQRAVEQADINVASGSGLPRGTDAGKQGERGKQ